MLRAAVRLSLTDDQGTAWTSAAAHVRVQDVASAIGVGRTALYRLWETQEAFRKDLLLFAYAQTNQPVLTDDELGSWLADIGDRVIDPSSRAMRAVAARVSSGPWPVVISGLAGYLPSPRLAELDRQLRDDDVHRTTILLARIGRGLGRRPMAPATWTDLAELMDVLVCGTAISSLVAPWTTVPDWQRDATGRPRSMLAAMAAEVFDRLTVDGPEDEVAYERATAPRPMPAPRWTVAQRRALAAGVELLRRELSGASVDLAAFETVTVARLARAAGVSRQTVYSRWRSDDDLRLDVLRRFADAHIRSFRSIDHDPWVPTRDWRQTLSFAMGFLAFADRTGPRLPWLAFAPYARDPRVGGELERVARYCIAQAAEVSARGVAAFGGERPNHHTPQQRAEMGFAGWMGARRRAQIRLRLDPSPEVWRTELRLTSLLVHLFSGAPDADDLPRLLGPLADVELPAVLG